MVNLYVGFLGVSADLSIVYDLPVDILSTLAPREDAGQEGITSPPTIEETTTQGKTDTGASSKACSLCGVTFQTVEDQRSHVRSDLHGYNLKQRVRGAKPVTENEFEKLVGGELFPIIYHT